jgi:hypothetical protein
VVEGCFWRQQERYSDVVEKRIGLEELVKRLSRLIFDSRLFIANDQDC